MGFKGEEVWEYRTYLDYGDLNSETLLIRLASLQEKVFSLGFKVPEPNRFLLLATKTGSK